MSGFGKMVDKLKVSAPGADIVEGIMVHSSKFTDKIKKVAEKYL